MDLVDEVLHVGREAAGHKHAAKSVFQVHGVDAEGHLVIRRQLKRRQVVAFFQKMPPCLVGVETCASSHYGRSEGEFRQSDIVFLQGVANILGMAIERQRMEVNLRAALDRQQLLLREANHRVNNSLQIVAAMLHLQSSSTENDDVRHELREAGSRIAAIARAHQRLYSSGKIETLDLGVYLTDVCNDLTASIPACEINVTTEQGIVTPTDRGITVVLLVNELVTNAIKHAYPGGRCRIWVSLSRNAEGAILIAVRDEGVGLPPDFDIRTGRRLGMRLVNAFTQQLHGNLQVMRRAPGTEFVVTIPTSDRS